MATASRRVAVICAGVSATASACLAWLTATGSPMFERQPEVGYTGAAITALLAILFTRARPRPADYDATRVTTADRVVWGVEAAAYLFAALIGLDWLILRLLGRAAAPNEDQRVGLWVLAAAAALLLMYLVGTARRRRREENAGRAASEALSAGAGRPRPDRGAARRAAPDTTL